MRCSLLDCNHLQDVRQLPRWVSTCCVPIPCIPAAWALLFACFHAALSHSIFSHGMPPEHIHTLSLCVLLCRARQRRICLLNKAWMKHSSLSSSSSSGGGGLLQHSFTAAPLSYCLALQPVQQQQRL
jgi:hypothetical protein